MNALCEAYEDFEPAVRFPMIREGDGSAEVFQEPYCFSFSFRGDTSNLQERIIGIFRIFDCPVYDPQAAILYPVDKPFAALLRGDNSGWKPPLKTKAELEPLMAELRARAEEVERKQREENRAWYEPVERLASEISRECAGGRWQRLGIDAETCAAVLHNMQLLRQRETESPPNDNLALMHNLNLVFLGYLGAIPPGHERADSKAEARAGVARAIEFCYGAWRDGYQEFSYSKPMSRARTRAKLGWITPYREGLLLALYVDDEDAIRQLIEWPDADLPVDDGLTNLTAGDNHAHIALALLLRGEPGARIGRY